MNTNNKKFRKSTIVIPALALMVLTAGASATGAVAWFTATRQVTANASTFTAASTTSALTIEAAAGQGTTVATNKIDVSVGTNYLCDASYDASYAQGTTIGKLYRSVLDDDGGNPTGFAEVSADGYDTQKKTNDGQHEIFYAVNWTYTFTYSTTNPAGSALLFDLSSTFSSAEKTAAGFRIAFNNINADDNNKNTYRVWTNSDTSTYVNGTDSASTATYSASYIAKNSTPYTRVSDATSSGTVRALPEYLGTFTNGASAVTSIQIRCTAWYEGTDPSVVVVENQLKDNPAITARMTFYVRDLAA